MAGDEHHLFLPLPCEKILDFIRVEQRGGIGLGRNPLPALPGAFILVFSDAQDVGFAQALGNVFQGGQIGIAEKLMQARITQKGFPAFPVMALELGQVLQNRPELDPIPSHQPRRRFDDLHLAQGGEFIHEKQHR